MSTQAKNKTNTATKAPRVNNRYLQLLINHYNTPLEPIFKQFRLGVIAFGVGLTCIIIANTHLTPSLAQELAVLAGLISIGAGFVTAMLAQVRLLISRILQFIWRDKF